jgi:uncharacterized protein YbbK (DUF523 family)
LYPTYKTLGPKYLFLPPLLVVGSSILLPMADDAQSPLSAGPMLVSACLAGRACRFDGSSNEDDRVSRLVAEGRAVLICPEMDGGLGTPRPRAEIVGGDGSDVLEGTARVVTEHGRDVTGAYLEGARRALEASQSSGARVAILKSRSPSCGNGAIYDGTFSHSLVAGDGVTAALLRDNGVEVLTDEELGPD